ncbi:MAG: hypothetical protein H6745_13815 [Deltaproteobacteria bacterium]|nr:hypothetical protein [Deltaproteobacteria bacterium]
MTEPDDTIPGQPPPHARPPEPPAARPPTQGSPFWHMVKVLLVRAFHSDLEPVEVLPDEVGPLSRDNVHGGSEPLRRVLLWRRAALLVAFLFQIPPLIVRIINAGVALGENGQDIAAGLEFFLVLLELGVLVAIYAAMRRWASWHRSRRVLLWTWAASFLAPFLFSLVPLRSVYAPNADGPQGLIFGAFLGVAVFIQLAPKVLALIPGILRAAIIAKAAFPMSSMPGRVIQIAAPFDSLLMFVVLILPYQMTGGGWMVPAILLLTLAPIFFYVGGKRLAKPHTLELALKDIGWTRRGAIAGNLLGGLCLVVGLMVTVGSVEFNGSHLIGFGDIFLAVFTLIAEIFRLEVIGIDIMLGAMVGLHEGRRARAADVDAAEAAYERELDVLAAARRADIDRSAQSAPKPPPQPPGGGPS